MMDTVASETKKDIDAHVAMHEDVWTILKQGVGWHRAELGDRITVNIEGRDAGGNQVERRENFDFVLGADSVPSSWNDAFRSMARCEKVRLAVSEQDIKNFQLPKDAKEYELEMVSWMPRRDLFADGRAVESLLTQGEGWERPDKLAEVHAVFTLRSDEDEPGILFGPEERTASLSTSDIPEVVKLSIGARTPGSVVSICCKSPHSEEVCKFLGVEPVESCVLEMKMLFWLKVEDVYKDGSVVKKVLKDGLGWEKPGDTCQVQLKLTYRQLGSNQNLYEEEKDIKVGFGFLPDELDAQVEGMKRGEHVVVLLKRHRAFERTPALAPPNVDPEMDLEVEVEMVNFTRAPAIWTMPFEEGLEAMKTYKERGKELFSAGRFEKSLRLYKMVSEAMDRTPADLTMKQREQLDNIRASCLVNMSLCQDKLCSDEKMYEFANMAVNITPSNPKALYRRGSASFKLGNFYTAQTDLRYAAELTHRRNHEVLRKLKEVNSKIAEEERDERNRFAKRFRTMFSKPDR